MDFGKKQLGNWVITKYNKKGVPFIQVKPVSGEYLWEYSSFDEMFLHIENAIDNSESHNGLQTCLGIMGSFIHASNPVFYDLFVKCLEEYGKIAEVRKPTTREEEREIIADMKVSYELSEELKKSEEESEEVRNERYRQEKLMAESARNEGDDTK